MIRVYFMPPKCQVHERNLNYDFSNFCEWFMDNKLSTHFGEDKTQSILFKRGNESNLSLNITRNENVIKQHSVVSVE